MVHTSNFASNSTGVVLAPPIEQFVVDFIESAQNLWTPWKLLAQKIKEKFTIVVRPIALKQRFQGMIQKKITHYLPQKVMESTTQSTRINLSPSYEPLMDLTGLFTLSASNSDSQNTRVKDRDIRRETHNRETHVSETRGRELRTERLHTMAATTVELISEEAELQECDAWLLSSALRCKFSWQEVAQELKIAVSVVREQYFSRRFWEKLDCTKQLMKKYSALFPEYFIEGFLECVKNGPRPKVGTTADRVHALTPFVPSSVLDENKALPSSETAQEICENSRNVGQNGPEPQPRVSDSKLEELIGPLCELWD